MITIGSVLLLIILMYGKLKFQSNYLTFVLKTLIFFSIYLNVGYFFKMGSFELAYSEFIIAFMVFVSLFRLKFEISISKLIPVLFFGIVIFLGFLFLINSSNSIMVLPIGGSWDAYFYGRESFTEATWNNSHILRIIRITMFFAAYYIFDKYVVSNKDKSIEIKKFIVNTAFFIAGFGIVEQFFKLFLSSNFVTSTVGYIFGVGSSQVTVLFERGALPALQGLMREPGLFAQAFIPAILLLFLDPLFSEKQRFSGLLLFGYVIFSSGSFAGVPLLLLITLLFIFSHRKKIIAKLSCVIGFAFLAIIAIYEKNPSMIQYYMLRVHAFTSGENVGTSESIRLQSVKYAMNLFYDHPLLGIGFGTTSVSGFIPTILVNVGVLGALMWVLIMINGFSKSKIDNLVWLIILIPIFCFIGGMRSVYGLEMVLIFGLVFRKVLAVDPILEKSDFKKISVVAH